MILFQSDWQRYPGAIPDYTTTNISFVRMARLLHEMGVKNCLFFLALHNPELQGVDPFSPNLTDGQKVAIYLEARYNPWYYFRELVRIPPKAGDEIIPFKLNRGSLSLYWLFFNHIDVFLIMLRQVGKTVGMAALVQGCLRFWMENSMIGQVTKDTSLKLETIDAIKEIGERLPQYLIDLNVKEDNPDSKTGIYYDALGNTFKSMVGRNDRKAANNVFRGSTPPMVWFDEPPFIPFIGITVPAVLGAMGNVVDEAARNNQPFGRVFTTTPGNVDDRDGGYIYGLVQESCRWSDLMLDSIDLEDLKDTIRVGSAHDNVMSVNCTFTHNQLGYTDEWLAKKIAESRGTKEQADKDYRVMWSSGGANSPLSVEQTNAIRDSEMNPIWEQIYPQKYIFRWYDDKLTHESDLQQYDHILGIDSSEAVGRDATALVLINPRDLSVRGVATINDTNITRFAMWLCEFMIKYPKVTLIIERKSTGTGILDQLLYIMQSRNVDPFKRIYNRLVDDQQLRKEEYQEMRGTPLQRRDTYFYDKWRKDFGFVTDGARRRELYKDVLLEAVKRGARKVRDKTLAGELKALVTKKGRIDHPDGGHDDHCVAWLMTVWFLMISKHPTCYGIDSKSVFADISETGGDVSEVDRQHGKMIEGMNEDLENMFEQLRSTENPYQIVQLEQRIRTTNAKLAQAGGTASSVDALIREALAERQRRHLNARANQSRAVGNMYGYGGNTQSRFRI